MKALNIFDFITLALVLGASVYGMLRMFRSKFPMYFRLKTCGVWCFAFQLIYSVLASLCRMEMPEYFNLCFLGIGGCFIFFTSANYGQFNSLIDEHGKELRSIRIVSLSAPLVFLIAFILICLSVKNIPAYTVAVLATSAIPIMIGSYFNLKFLLIRRDDIGFLTGIIPINIAELVLYIIFYIYIFENLRGNDTAASVFYYIFTVSVASMVFLSEWGYKKWKKQF